MTLQEALFELHRQKPDAVLSDGTTDWAPGPLLQALQQMRDPDLDRPVQVSERGIWFLSPDGSQDSAVAYEFKENG
ncbi:MAG: hypothetical protein JO069_07545 [Verrucomicrobia bacterium]|nr:hypothetical protein [Verrucomicrobiota bacterium]